MCIIGETVRRELYGGRVGENGLGEKLRVKQFSCEVIGILLATAASYGASGLMGVPYVFDPSINLLALSFSAFIGVVFGYFPARRAAQMDPIEALRHE